MIIVKTKFQFFQLCSFLLLFLFLNPQLSLGAVLYFQPSGGVFYFEETFPVEVKIKTEGECINVVKGEIKYSFEVLEVRDFFLAESILKLWIQPPQVLPEEGKIIFIGGIPGEYCGTFLDNENSLLKIIFQVKNLKEERLAQLEFSENSQIFLNDGQGSLGKLNFEKASFKISAQKKFSKEESWKRIILEDKIPPEPFEIIISKDPLIFDGKYFIVFETQDKQSGIDHYEVKEGKSGWKRAKSPYLLEDQTLKSEIQVKAIDKAGNERISRIIPQEKTKTIWAFKGLSFVLFVSFFLLLFAFQKKRKNDKIK